MLQTVEGRPLRGPALVRGDEDSEEHSQRSLAEDKEDKEVDAEVRAREAAYNAYGRQNRCSVRQPLKTK